MKTDAAKTLNFLRQHYGRNGEPYALNDVQTGIYTEMLTPFTADQLKGAVRQWLRDPNSRFFPAVADLLRFLEPAHDAKADAQLAWVTFERAIRSAGVYRGVTFEDWALGETVRQVFGTWSHACNYDQDSPGWHGKKQTFLAIYPTFAAQPPQGPVTLKGIAERDWPYVISMPRGSRPALPSAAATGVQMPPLDKAESIQALETLRKLSKGEE